MLDEIARLRSLLEHCHGRGCAILRKGVCDCGYETQEEQAVLEIARLRAQLQECHRVIDMHCREIARLSAQVVARPVPPALAEGTVTGPPPAPAPRLKRATTAREPGPTPNPARNRNRARAIKAAHLPTRR